MHQASLQCSRFHSYHFSHAWKWKAWHRPYKELARPARRNCRHFWPCPGRRPPRPNYWGRRRLDQRSTRLMARWGQSPGGLSWGQGSGRDRSSCHHSALRQFSSIAPRFTSVAPSRPSHWTSMSSDHFAASWSGWSCAKVTHRSGLFVPPIASVPHWTQPSASTPDFCIRSPSKPATNPPSQGVSGFGSPGHCSGSSACSLDRSAGAPSAALLSSPWSAQAFVSRNRWTLHWPVAHPMPCLGTGDSEVPALLGREIICGRRGSSARRSAVPGWSGISGSAARVDWPAVPFWLSGLTGRCSAHIVTHCRRPSTCSSCLVNFVIMLMCVTVLVL